MKIVITIVAPTGRGLGDDDIAEARRVTGLAGDLQWIEPGEAADLHAEIADPAERADLRAALFAAMDARGLDTALQPATGRAKRLLVSDMDTTIIGQECIDELADFAGKREEVSDITFRAMAGDLDFDSALRERVALLAGLSVSTLERVFAERISLNPGAATLVATMRAHGAQSCLVSGGFTFFAERVAALAGFGAFQANILRVANGRLTGRVAEPILGRDAKRELLQEACERLAIGPDAAIGLGDGANDLALIEAAGLGIAYRAKPVLVAAASGIIAHGDLTAALLFQGYRRRDFARV